MNKIYKACQHSIVTMELVGGSKSNENRSNVFDPNYAKFRTNKIKVITIINVLTNEEMITDNSMHESNLLYKVGEIIESDYTDDAEIVCGKGIHYFKTYDAALSYYYRECGRTNGKRKGYFENGLKHFEINYKNGKHDGKSKEWYEDGQKRQTFNCQDGKFNGKNKYWYENGQKCYIRNFINGEPEGKHIEWYKNGQLKYIRNYINGEDDGNQEYWNEDGQKRCGEYYTYGKQVKCHLLK